MGSRQTKVKPCVGYLLDGNYTCSTREAAFTLAMEFRGLGKTESEINTLLTPWATLIGYRHRELERTVRSAFRKTSDGAFKYHPPGLRKKPGTTYANALLGVCEAVGCPQNCSAFVGKYVGDHSQSYQRFVQLNWPTQLRRWRFGRAADVYRAITVRERTLGIAPGSELRVTYKQLAALADGAHYTTVGRALPQLEALGLIEYTPGSGSGPHARDREASRVKRVIPIPSPPPVKPDIPPSINNRSCPATTHG